MKAHEYLGLWQLTSKGTSVPINYDELCRKIERLNSEIIGFQVVYKLESEGLIRTLPNGQRILTEFGLKKRIPLSTNPAQREISSEKNWERFRRLCSYYSDCITQSEKTQEYLFANDINTKFLFPNLPVNWINSDADISIKYSQRQEPAVNNILSRKEDSEDIYIGYPLSAFRCSDGQMGYSPILLFPLDINFSRYKISLKIRHDEIDINRTWVEFNIPKEDRKDLLSSLFFSAGENTGLLNATAAVQFISNRFKVNVDPNYLDVSTHKSELPEYFNRIADKKFKILNSAPLFVGNPLRFSKTLKRELREISNQPATVLDETALAFIFRDPPLKNAYEDSQDILPLDFLNETSNEEQFDALSHSLNTPVSKIQGPPGTGKSQVAVNLIANLVFNEQSVLFTSKNHKAIHAIFSRAENVSSDLPLLQFCSLPDGSAAANWAQQRPEDTLARCDLIWHENNFTDDLSLLRDFNDILINFRDSKKQIIEINNSRLFLQKIAAQYETLQKNIPKPLLDSVSVEFCKHINYWIGKLNEPSQKESVIIRFLNWILRRGKISQNAESELRKLLPTISANAFSQQTLKERASRLCADISDYLAVKKEENDAKILRLNLPMTQESSLSHGLAFLRKNVKTVFLYKRTFAILNIPDILLDKLKDAARQVERQNRLPFLLQSLSETKLKNAKNIFSQFSKFYPAWAVTLLSLPKASPCIAGLFDRLIVDEASQCEIPAFIPALYRAKGVTVIGDPKQFPPVITMHVMRHAYLRYQKHNLGDISEKFDFMTGNIFDVISTRSILLREHFRCNHDIAQYINEEFYSGKLRIRTNQEKLIFPRNLGFIHAIEWKNITNSINDEISEVCSLIDELEANTYKGSVGVISPLRKIVEVLKQKLHTYKILDISQDVNTANGFQGGERDLIIFVLGLTSNTSKGEQWYIESQENQYIYNVAVSRARACLIVVGDRERAQQSQLSALRKLSVCKIKLPTQAYSPGEQMLYDALCKAGFEITRQYPLAGRYLDLALIQEKIDIEVDGEAFHLNQYGERKQDDVYRDLQVQSCGWRVCRFWYKEVRDNIGLCIKKVSDLVNNIEHSNG
jgi:superfamily I DNA and/or RNA helicase/very-short-patch-repair endonuclease